MGDALSLIGTEGMVGNIDSTFRALPNEGGLVALAKCREAALLLH